MKNPMTSSGIEPESEGKKETEKLVGLGVGSSIILKWILMKRV
jgi:hypothetical protein